MVGRRRHPTADPAAMLPAPSPTSRSSPSPASRATPQVRDGALGTATAPGHHQHHHEQYQQQHHYYRDEGAPTHALGAPAYVRSHVAAAAEEDEEVYARNRHHFDCSRVHSGSSASEYWEHHHHQMHASPSRERLSVHALPPPSPSRQLQHHGQQQQQQLEQDAHDASLHYYPQRNSYPPPSHSHYRPTRSQTQQTQQQLHRTSSYDNVEREHARQQHAALTMRRSFTGKRKADEQSDTSLAFVGYTTSHAENVHLTSPPPSARDDATVFYSDTFAASSPSRHHQHQRQHQHAERYAASAPTERASHHHRHQQQRHYEQQHRGSQPLRSHSAYHGSDPSLSASLRPAWLPHRSGEASHSDNDNDSGDGEEEDESKASGMQRSSAPPSRTAPLVPPIQSMAQVSVSHRSDAAVTERAIASTSSPPPTLTLPPYGRVITNASRNITFAMLQPHFERPLQEAALRFGVCTTLLKKICRKNGIKNWPFRRICGLHKSIASMEKQVHYFDGEQKRSYADQLYKLQLELEAFKRTGNAPTPAFIAKIEAEGGVVPSDSRSTSDRRQDRLPESDALLSLRGGGYSETKTEDPVLGYRNHHHHGHTDSSSNSNSCGPRRAAALSPPALSAVSTHVSVSSYRYTSSVSPSQADDERAQPYPYYAQQQQQQQYAHAVSTHRVMASTVDLGYDNDDRDERASAHHLHSAARHGQREVQQQQQHALQQRALPSLSFMLHRQSQPPTSQGGGAAEGAPRASPLPHADGSAAYTSPNQHRDQEHHF